MTIRKTKRTEEQQPSYKLGMGSTPRPDNVGGFIGQTIPVKHSERRPLSLEEAGRDRNQQETLYGLPGSYIVRSKERRYNTETGWYDI